MTNNGIDVKGTRDAIRIVGKIDPEFRKQARRDIYAAVKPLQLHVRDAFPSSPPLSGMTRGRLAYTNKAKTGVTTKTFGRDRSAGVYYLAAIKQANPAGVMFDMAGRKSRGNTPQGQAMIRNLDARHGKASRAIYPTIARHKAETIRDIERIVDRVALRLSVELNAQKAGY